VAHAVDDVEDHPDKVASGLENAEEVEEAEPHEEGGYRLEHPDRFHLNVEGLVEDENGHEDDNKDGRDNINVVPD